jgi:hypothetical protein
MCGANRRSRERVFITLNLTGRSGGIDRKQPSILVSRIAKPCHETIKGVTLPSPGQGA